MKFESFIKMVIDTTLEDCTRQMMGKLPAGFINWDHFREGTFVDFQMKLDKDEPGCLGYFRETCDGFGITIILPVLESIVNDDEKWYANAEWTDHSKILWLFHGYDARFTAKLIETIYHEFQHGMDAFVLHTQMKDYIGEYMEEEQKNGYWNNRFEVAARENQRHFGRTAKKFFSREGELVDYKNM